MNDSKWIVVMGTEDYRDALNEIFLRSGIMIFSEVQAKGYRFTQSQMTNETVPANLMDPVYSLVCFALTESTRADALMSEIETFNQNHERARPLHAFQVQVEKMV